MKSIYIDKLNKFAQTRYGTVMNFTATLVLKHNGLSYYWYIRPWSRYLLYLPKCIELLYITKGITLPLFLIVLMLLSDGATTKKPSPHAITGVCKNYSSLVYLVFHESTVNVLIKNKASECTHFMHYMESVIQMTYTYGNQTKMEFLCRKRRR